MNALQKVFEYQGVQVRTVIKNGEPWFIAKDVCDVFGETNRNRAMQSLDGDEKGYTQMTTPGGVQQVAIVNEPGLYSLLFAMQPSKARGMSEEYILQRAQKLREFKRWVTHEVLPSIRKHGAYLTADTIEKVLADPDTIIQIATSLKEDRQRRMQAEQMIEANKPKVLFADAVTASHSSILVGELAKLLRQNGVDTGQNRLFEWMRNNGFLIRRKGTDYNMPTQMSMEMGLFEIKETTVVHSDGHTSLNKTPKITGKGQVYFINKMCNSLQR